MQGCRRVKGLRLTACNATPPAASARSEPLAVWQPGEGAPPLDRWLADQPPDARQQLTILAHYPPAGQAQVLATAQHLALQAEKAGFSARLVIEPGTADMVVTLAYDDPARQLARGLLEAGGNPPPSGETP